MSHYAYNLKMSITYLFLGIKNSDSFLQETIKFIEDLSRTIPNSEYYERKQMDIKDMVPKAIEREFTDIVILNEDKKKCSIFFIFIQDLLYV